MRHEEVCQRETFLFENGGDLNIYRKAKMVIKEKVTQIKSKMVDATSKVQKV